MIYPQINEPYTPDIEPSLLESTALAVLDHIQLPTTPDMSIVITGDADIQVLNKEFMDIDAPTDVLAFPSDELDLDTGNRYLGDVIISYPRALEQAAINQHTAAQEVQLLVVHGVLHLLGYDHRDATDQAKMWREQGDILLSLQNPRSRLFV
jgi:probable rRNA maturation factor